MAIGVPLVKSLKMLAASAPVFKISAQIPRWLSLLRGKIRCSTGVEKLKRLAN
jgi:hypothetical protein